MGFLELLKFLIWSSVPVTELHISNPINISTYGKISNIYLAKINVLRPTI